ncbi:MAG TPA: aspartate--ammonia ligase [Bacteroidales bacterium]|nr:aspartate--ammonia ligase [Bacteroidales bacterium]
MDKRFLQAEEAIEFIKVTFSQELCERLKLTKVSSPIAVIDGTGINDDLNGVERPVRFPVRSLNGRQAVVVHSLAKWKRVRLKQLDVNIGEGILTDMRALRPDEECGPLHSVYVDQWDWEMHIAEEQRTLRFLKLTVEKIYESLKTTERIVSLRYPDIVPVLPEKITFIHSEELLQKYPGLTPREREDQAAREYKAIFIIGIGGEMSNGEVHDGRAPDYDDWSTVNGDGKAGLNGDIIFWNPVLEKAFEISSMGIRVDKPALLRQLERRGCTERENLPFHKMLLSGYLPQSIGGGIGQSRVCMFMLRKSHIGEVQVGIWSEETEQECLRMAVPLL